MKIGMVRYRGRTKYFDKKEAGYLGWDSIAYILDGQCIYNHEDAAKMEFDVVFFVATLEAREWLIKNGRPKGWKKLIYFPYSCAWQINNVKYINDILRINFDAFAIMDESYDMLKIFDKPYFYFKMPYDFSNDEELRKRPKKRKICLIIKNTSDPLSNYLSTLYVFKQIKNVTGVVTTNPATPYKHDTRALHRVVKNLGINNLEVVHPFQTRGEYLEYISDCRVMFTMDSRMGIGRNVVDAVSLGMISISPYSAMQKKFYPEYMPEMGSGIKRSVDILKYVMENDVKVCGIPGDLSYENVKKYYLKELANVN